MLPKYCDFFQTLLVEELVLETDYQRLHYGKCAVIGRLCSEPDLFKLQNVRVNHLPREFTLPSGVVSVLLLDFGYDKANDEGLAHDSLCIVRGEVVLCNVHQPNSPRLTTRGVHEQLMHLSAVERTSFLENLHQTHKPAISVWYSQRIEQAEELLQRKLEIRML